MATTTSSQLTVRYAETDAQGIVHHANYLVWFEEGRSDYLRQNGLRYTDFEAAGFFVVVVEAETRYCAPARYEDVLTVETTLAQLRGKVLKFSYRVLRGTELLATGRTTHVVLDSEHRPVALPAEFYQPLLAEAAIESQ